DTNLISGQVNSSLVLGNVQTNQTGSYYAIVSNGFGYATSSPALLMVLPNPPVITLQPKNATVYQGGNVTFSVQHSGAAPFTYQWFLGSTPLNGKTSPVLALTNIQFAQAGNYSAIVSNQYGFAVSSNALLTVLPTPPCVTPPEGIVAWWRAESNMVDSV